MVVVPIAAPVKVTTEPAGDMFTIPADDNVQLPPAVALLSVMEEPTQTEPGPLMPSGSGLTVKVMEAVHAPTGSV